jgi:hypothetical protein
MGSHLDRHVFIGDGARLRLRRACKGDDLWVLEQKRKEAPRGYYQIAGRAEKLDVWLALARAIEAECTRLAALAAQTKAGAT